MVGSRSSQYIEYAGSPLSPRTEYQWSITIEDDAGATHAAVATFETGKRDEAWSGRWIAAAFHGKPDEALDAPYLRRDFGLDRAPRRTAART